ncbi:MAG: WG repeat-containing protein, partial [Chryseobacterium sp.]
MMKRILVLALVFMLVGKVSAVQNQAITDSIPVNEQPAAKLIPVKKNGKYGYVNRDGKIKIQPSFSLALLFAEDCNLLNSDNAAARRFGTADFATAEADGKTFRIDGNGKRVYQYKTKDLGICTREFDSPSYVSFSQGRLFGVAKKLADGNPDLAKVVIAPQYQYIHILNSADKNEPMIIAVNNDRFGVVDRDNRPILPFEYEDIKRNYSWKIAHLFEVTDDGKNYYFVDQTGKAYRLK